MGRTVKVVLDFEQRQIILVSPEKILLRMRAKLLEMESRVAVVNFKMGRVWLFGRQNMCDNIATSYNSPVM